MEIVEKNGAIEFEVRVVPRASRTELVGDHSGALKVRIASPPVDGAANAELVRLFSKTFGVSKADIVIVRGQTSKTKRLKIIGVSASDLNKAIK